MKRIKNLFAKANKSMLIVNLALIVLGVLFIIFPENSVKIICYASGAILCLLGAYKLVQYFKDGIKDITSFGLAGGIGLVSVGLLLFFKPNFISDVLTILFGIILIISGIIKLQQAINVKNSKGKAWWTVLCVAVIALVSGLFALFFPFATRKVLFIFIGISLIVDGLLGIISNFYYTSRLPDDVEIDKDKVIDI